jgi:hypothetical protein
LTVWAAAADRVVTLCASAVARSGRSSSSPVKWSYPRLWLGLRLVLSQVRTCLESRRKANWRSSCLIDRRPAMPGLNAPSPCTQKVADPARFLSHVRYDSRPSATRGQARGRVDARCIRRSATTRPPTARSAVWRSNRNACGRPRGEWGLVAVGLVIGVDRTSSGESAPDLMASAACPPNTVFRLATRPLADGRSGAVINIARGTGRFDDSV